MLGICWGNYALINLIYYLAFPYSLTVTYISPSTSSHLIWSPAEKDSLIEWYHYLDKVMTSTILQSHMIINSVVSENIHTPPIEGFLISTEAVHKLDLSSILSSIHHILSPSLCLLQTPSPPLQNLQWPSCGYILLYLQCALLLLAKIVKAWILKNS